MIEFNQFLERCENTDGLLASVISKKSLSSDAHASRPFKLEKDREHKREMEEAKEKERSREKYMGKSIQELDLSDCQHSSQRSELGAQVLNDHWVSVTSGSEDYSFKHMRRNQYEESLFRCEDDRFELDMLLESVSSTAKRVEDLLNSINENKINMESPFRVEEHLTVLNLRCIERLYSDHGLDALEIVRFKELSVKSLVAEIKELKEKKQKEDDVLMASIAGHRQTVAPHLEYEYLDVNIHEDLYKLIEYSSEEICSTKEQLNKVMRLWTTFLEPMLGVPPRPYGRGNEAGKALNPVINCTTSSITESDGNPGAVAAASYGDGNSSPVQTNSCRKGLTNGETSPNEERQDRVYRDDSNLEKKFTFRADKRPTINKHTSGLGALAIEAENNHIRNGVEGASASKPCISASEDHEPEANACLVYSLGMDLCLSTTVFLCHLVSVASVRCGGYIILVEDLEGGDVTKHVSLANGVPTDGSNASKYRDESVGPSKIEKEEGELSSNGDFEEDNFVAYGDTGLKDVPKANHGGETRQYRSINRKALNYKEAGDENNADDEDSENASEAGNDASRSESPGDECSHEEEEEVEQDEVDGKAESEGEAEGIANTHVEGDCAPLSVLDRCLLTVKPLAKHVPPLLSGEAETVLACFMQMMISIFKLSLSMMDNKLLQLFEYENSRKDGKTMDSVYYENARVLLHEENIPTEINKKKYATLDEFAAICMAMEGVELVNGLENKIACNSYKISYVLDTEDFFFRRRKSPQSKSSYDNQARVQRGLWCYQILIGFGNRA
ncbi:hypothetical protein F3Y22_tig00112399pilonHSYRG00010 [Hibiscus syriacus]|uniref:Histone deacetylase interacting domain-containing protein n=1 Tax=Hibiscus syriacus TaxID=106335 RepID=A0A6A2YAD4_HIBSY|nr:hypothetical protein F3Y22_tig00112399pilonHSYRG00010 [Hibiscus syriacus]